MTGTGATPAVSPADIAALVPRLRRYAVALVGSVPDADDLVQDCVEKALVHRASLREADRLYSWMLAILHNQHVAGRRRWMRRGPEVAVEEMADALALSAPPADRTAVRDLVRAMARLPEEQRQVLLLNALEGFSYREMAEALDIPLGTVMSRLARGRERLRVLLEGGEQKVVRRIK